MPEQQRSGHYMWWKVAATHIFRTYYRFQMDGRQPDSPQKEHSFEICQQVLSSRNDFESEFLRGYFSTRWNTDEEFVCRFSDDSGVPETLLWRIVHDANREFFVRCNLLEPKAKR